MEKVKLNPGDEVIFMLPNKTIMEKVKVDSIDRKNGFALLANKVKVTRTLSDNGTFPRIDGKDGIATPTTEQNERAFQAYKAWFSILKNLDFLMDKVKIMGSDKVDIILDLDKKISKVITKYFPK